MEICDNRNEKLADKIKEMDVVLLAGGHVPTQNNFFHRIGLKNRLEDFNETVINPPAELGRLTDAGGGEQSIKIENSAV